MLNSNMEKGRLLLVGALCCYSALAFGHAVIDDPEKPAHTFQFIELRITHGCGKASTNRVTVTIPDGITRVSPRNKAGWSVSARMRRLDTPIELHGQRVTETVASLTWVGGPLPDGMYDTFEFRAMLPDDEGGVYRFPTVQSCVDGAQIEWSEVPGEGQSPWDLEQPAPFVVLTTAVKQY